jgi:hypothetical protein
MPKALNKKNDYFIFLSPFYCLLFRILTVTMVSIVKNKAKMMKKSIFSVLTFGFPEFRMGDKIMYDNAILIKVTKRKVNPTLSMFFSFTLIRIRIISNEQLKKKPYTTSIGK